MEISPVRRYREPGFPTRAILDAHPELLRLVPRRWRGNPLVLTALAATFVILSGCRSLAAGKGPPARASLVAPIFVHGAGRGGFGCRIVNPPVFLPEDEARQVITQEAKRVGLSFAPDDKKVRVRMPMTARYSGESPAFSSRPRASSHRSFLTLDGTDKKRHISYEYVSLDDFNEWRRQDGGPHSTVFTVNMVRAATELRQSLLKAKPAGISAIFYEPVGQSAKDEREQLRQQVRDFVAWLKAQGVI